MKIEKEYDNIFRYVFYRVNCREEAEDITQETFCDTFSIQNIIK